MNINKSISFAWAAMAVAFFLLAARAGAAEKKPADVDYYTCAMHPSVKSQDPKAKCPICGMDLAPVKKKPAPGDQTGATVPEPAGTESDTNLEVSQPSEFTVPVERQQQIGVTYAAVKKRMFHYAIRAVGVVAADRQRQWDYVPRVAGYVQRLFVFSPGEMVESNAPLLTIYSPEVFTAEKELVNALRTRTNAGAEELVAAAEERLRLWNVTGEQMAALEKSLEPEEYLTLRSPFKGMVESVGAEQGQALAAGERVVDLADFSGVWVWAQFYQDDLPLLKKGLPATVTVSRGFFRGKISVIDPFMNDATRTARVRIDVENPDFKLRPGMYANVDVTGDLGEELAAPVNAVLPTGLHNIVFVDKGGGRLEPRFIEVGREDGDFYEVKSGLKENERIVASANFLIDAEAQVQGALKEW